MQSLAKFKKDDTVNMLSAKAGVSIPGIIRQVRYCGTRRDGYSNIIRLYRYSVERLFDGKVFDVGESSLDKS